MPLIEGPKKAPKAKVEVHNPLTSPYVSILSWNPFFRLDCMASVKVETNKAPIPKPCKTRPTIVRLRSGSIGMNGAGPIRQNPRVMKILPNKQTICNNIVFTKI